MKLIVQILMLFIIINSIMKLSLWKIWQTAIFSTVCGIFIVLTYPYAILQSKTVISDYLHNTKIMQDTAVIVTTESAICFAFCVAAMRDMFGRNKNRWVEPLRWFVSLLIFPVFFYILIETIYALPGVSFSTVAYALAAITTVTLPLLAWGMKKIIPEEEMRLEIYFLVTLFVTIIGLLTTVNGNVTYKPADTSIEWKDLLIALSIFALFFISGYVWNGLKWRIKEIINNKKIIK